MDKGITNGDNMSLDYLIQLDKEFLLNLNGSDSLFLDNLVLTLTDAKTWIPLYMSLFYVVLRNNDSMKKILLILSCAGLCVLLAGTIDDTFVKPYIARPRPTHDMQIGMIVDVVNGYRGGDFGFFSAHAANTFSIAVFFCFLMRSQVLSPLLIVWSFINCWTRMYLGVHYPGDILCGLIWGGLVGVFVYYIYYHINHRIATGMRFISSQYTSTGYQHTDIDVVVLTLFFTFLYALIRACVLSV